ncbi:MULTISPECIES: carbohydrate ABC transporter permease [unclassified Rhizobium]|uniref:carbohydrate ABC transporter permease n=1 Tax=unclassified Rhizobium TaxID=2613769 RepID=UPI00381C5C71
MTSQLATTWRRSIGLASIASCAIGLYAIFLIYPILQSLLTSFTDRNPLRRESSFIGFQNYIDLAHDQRLLRSLIFTLTVTVFVAIVSNVLGLLIALLLNRSTANYKLMRTLIFLPQILSGVIVAFIWRSILTQNGLLNVTLQNLGLTDTAISWIGTPSLATLSICVVVSWTTTAFATVIYTASLQSVPLELYEAARMDGAGALNRFRHVTLPMIAPGMTISVTLSLITTLKLFDVIAVLTGGGPANATKSIAYYLIDVAFTGNRLGYASAIAMLLLVLTAVISYGTSGILRRREAHL